MVGRSLAVLLLVAIARCEEDEVVVSKNLSELLQEVEFGKTAVLHCHSNDDGHFFLFWQLAKEGIVGPGNKFDTSKYNYEILTGNLFIRVSIIYQWRTQEFSVGGVQILGSTVKQGKTRKT